MARNLPQKFRCFVAVCLATVLATPVLADRLDDVKARGKLVVGVSDTTPPFSFRRADGTLTGYDLDIVRQVASRLGVTLDMVPVSSAERIPMLENDKLDFVATSMTRTATRLKQVDFSAIYFVTPHAVIVKSASGIASVKQLSGKKVSSASTSTAGENLKEVVADAEIVYVRDYALAFAALKDGKVDGFTTDESVLKAIVQQDGATADYKFLPDFTKSRNVGFALKKGETRFKAAIDAILIDLEANGEAAGIFTTWFGPKSEQPMDRTFKIRPD